MGDKTERKQAFERPPIYVQDAYELLYKSYKNPVKPYKFKYLSNKNVICEIIFLVSIIVRLSI